MLDDDADTKTAAGKKRKRTASEKEPKAAKAKKEIAPKAKKEPAAKKRKVRNYRSLGLSSLETGSQCPNYAMYADLLLHKILALQFLTSCNTSTFLFLWHASTATQTDEKPKSAKAAKESKEKAASAAAAGEEGKQRWTIGGLLEGDLTIKRYRDCFRVDGSEEEKTVKNWRALLQRAFLTKGFPESDVSACS